MDINLGITEQILQRFDALVAQYGQPTYEAAVGAAHIYAIKYALAPLVPLILVVVLLCLAWKLYKKAQEIHSDCDPDHELYSKRCAEVFSHHQGIFSLVFFGFSIASTLVFVASLSYSAIIGVFDPEGYLAYLALHSILK